MTGKGAVKQIDSGWISTQQENSHAGNSQQTGIAHSFIDGPLYQRLVAGGIRLGDQRKQEHGHGVCKGAGKHNQRQGHTGKHAVDTKRGLGIIAVGKQPVGNINGFNTL